MFKTEQENFWAGEFGDDYISRNSSADYLAANIAFFSRILEETSEINSLIEFGPNIGMNLQAIKALLPKAELSGIEINQSAADKLVAMGVDHVYRTSILDFVPEKLHDFVLIKGVLIHINPDELKRVYKCLYDSSRKYICIAEYYNPSPVSITYRGHENRLFKRDFAGEVLDMYPDLKLVDYGFAYHRGVFPQDDITWFLLEKS